MKSENVLILTYWNYSDALIQTYTLPYVEIIKKTLSPDSKIILVTLEKSADTKQKSVLKNGIIHLPLTYFPFGIKAMWEWYKSYRRLKKIIRDEKINTIHAWCTPAGAIAYYLSKRTKTKLIIDSFEPHAEAMVENNTWKKNSLAFKLLFRLEKKQTHHATHLIAAAKGMEIYAANKYNYNGTNYFYKPACVDFKLFNSEKINHPQLLKELDLEGKIIGVYAGKFGGIYYEEEAFDLIASAEKFFGSEFRFLLLSNYPEEKRRKFELEKNIQPSTIIQKFVPHAEIPDYLGLADFGITPVKPVPTKRFCTPIKDGEYWALGLPVIISKDISNDSSIIEEHNIGYVLKNYSEEEFQKAFSKIKSLIESKTETQKRAIAVADKFRNFSIAEKIYGTIYSE